MKDKKDSQFTISVISGLIPVFLGMATRNLWVFLLLSALTVCLISEFDREDRKTGRLYFFGGAIGFVLAVSVIFSNGSIRGYAVQIISMLKVNGGGAGQQEEPDPLKLLDDQRTEIERQEEEAVRQLDMIHAQMEDMQAKIEEMSSESGQRGFLAGRIDEKETEEIRKEICAIVDEEEALAGWSDDRHGVELLYKTRLSEKPWYYCNIIRAFQEQGVDCEGLSIDEHTLILWDIQFFYLNFSIKQAIETDAAEDTFYSDGTQFSYNTYKVDMAGYSDVFDYEDFGISFNNVTAVEANDAMNEELLLFYDKLKMNFKEDAP